MIIERKAAPKLKALKAWTLVFGRRKTGKTFMVRNSVLWDRYFFVRRDRTISDDQGTLNYETFIEALRNGLIENKRTIVIDEFHRLPESFFDYLHQISPDRKGRLILISSTLSLAKKFFSSKSPLLGLFAEMLIPIFSLNETLAALPKNFPLKDKLELAVLMREPLTIQLLENNLSKESLSELVQFSRKAIPSLIGETFSEEERTLSAIYEGILRAVATGKVISGEISSYLFSRKLLEKDNPSLIQQHLLTLIELGILRRIIVFDQRKFIYKHTSPLVKMFYLADEKYTIGERELNPNELQEIISMNLPIIIEDNVREFLSQKLGLTESVAEGSDYEVDGLLLKFKKPEVALEVKWKKSLKREDIEKAIKNLGKFNVKRKILFVPDKNSSLSFKEELKSIEVMDVNDLEK
ncbi:AAA family ATPase [Candidatus Woesearchaeota archaeon]|nr:AAA family ATPase [Candidatus Woesearchaeota archaeon]